MNQIKIAVVDDDVVMLELMKFQIKKSGVSAKFYNSGVAFLEDFPYRTFDALLLDQNLPDFTALELIEILGEKRSALQVYIMTGNLQSSEVKDEMAISTDGILTKPFSPSSIIKKIEERAVAV